MLGELESAQKFWEEDVRIYGHVVRLLCGDAVLLS